MIQYFRLHGVRIRIDSYTDRIPFIFAKTFGLIPSSTGKKADIALIFKRIGKKRISLPPSGIRLRLIRAKNIKGRYLDRKLFLSDLRSHVTVDYRAGKALFLIDEATLEAPKLFTHTLMPLALVELLKSHGFYYLHASCAELDGKGVLFAGPPASGKTTACYSLVRQGAGWVSDDAVLIKRVGKRIIAHSFIKEFGIKTGREALFYELKAKGSGISSKRDISDAPGIARLYKMRTEPRLIVVLDHLLGKKDDRPASKASDIIGGMIGQNEFLFLDRKDAEEILDDLEELVRQASIIRPESRDILLNSQALAERLSKLAS